MFEITDYKACGLQDSFKRETEQFIGPPKLFSKLYCFRSDAEIVSKTPLMKARVSSKSETEKKSG